MNGTFDFMNPTQKQAPVRVDICPLSALPEDIKRLKVQNGEVLQILLNGATTNAELAETSLKYTSRISDIRAWIKKHDLGWKIVNTRLENGLTIYRLDTE